jgi:hypothetical protein
MYLDATSPTGEVVTYVGPTATDDCNPIVILTGVPASGSLFAPGDTVVTFTAVDAAGNTNSCTFIVHVYGAAEQLLNLANHFASGYARQVERSLMRPLQSAARSAAKGRWKPACRAITVFVRHLLSRSAKGQIYSDDVPNSMEAVMRIRALLNCQ